MRRMGLADIGWALDLTGREGWGFVRSDILRILEHTPGGSFVASQDGRRAGMLTTLCHGRSCWVGNVVVESDQRGAGLGRLLVQAAIRFAASKGKRRVALLSRERTVGFYEALGFSRGERFVGLSGVPAKGLRVEPAVVAVTPGLFCELAAMDRRATGEDRRLLLELLARDFRRHFLVYVEEGRALGFIVGKTGKGMVDAGPWTCARGRPDVAGSLFRALASRARARLEIYVPANDRWALDFLEGAGLHKTAGFRQMHRGGRAPRPSPLVEEHAIAGLEKG